MKPYKQIVVNTPEKVIIRGTLMDCPKGVMIYVHEEDEHNLSTFEKFGLRTYKHAGSMTLYIDNQFKDILQIGQTVFA